MTDIGAKGTVGFSGKATMRVVRTPSRWERFTNWLWEVRQWLRR